MMGIPYVPALPKAATQHAAASPVARSNEVEPTPSPPSRSSRTAHWEAAVVSSAGDFLQNCEATDGNGWRGNGRIRGGEPLENLGGAPPPPATEKAAASSLESPPGSAGGQASQEEQSEEGLQLLPRCVFVLCAVNNKLLGPQAQTHVFLCLMSLSHVIKQVLS
eukprot:Skav235054  [mRNA]  locus=scaffold3697:116092:120930:- [translate_table: standard]